MKPEFRMFLMRDCVVKPPPERKAIPEAVSLPGFFAPKLIELAIGDVATMLKKAGADSTVRAAGHVFTSLYVADQSQALRPNPGIGCPLGVYGETPLRSLTTLRPVPPSLNSSVPP